MRKRKYVQNRYINVQIRCIFLVRGMCKSDGLLGSENVVRDSRIWF
ncbi:hypothetical protein AAS21_gp183 [Pantoea phage vB_PagS_AAS21]|uniref:Uncharacterized protein n=1 Tax=Pantoea phage vB_PagS_AAS21 TaxID=2575261 RepID=A0A4Y5P1T1_9CAUD|nr:hypothetical protein AAS21_gp183 [Pantoea phage vB_PagS_AAS21]